ncbi:syntaxin-5 isoform X2 [Dermacentor albipictus]|uniref:syntaxin-5 isoform X2 n=1 Tax=Dermacentor albipictus TaxID=60249 RepID=UPI0038FC808B
MNAAEVEGVRLKLTHAQRPRSPRGRRSAAWLFLRRLPAPRCRSTFYTTGRLVGSEVLGGLRRLCRRHVHVAQCWPPLLEDAPSWTQMIARRRRTVSRTDHEDSFALPVSACAATFVSTMTSRDRTAEFKSAAKLMQGTMALQQHRMRRPGDRGAQEWGRFMHAAKQIGKDIASTFAKLEKLTLLARRKTIFDDRPEEIQELTYIIKQDISSLNKAIAQLQEVARSRNQLGGKHMQSHSNSVVVSLQSKLASMSNDFKSILEVRTENLKHQKSRREQFGSQGVSAALPPSAMGGGSVLLADEYASRQQGAGGGDFLTINMDEGPRHRQQQQQQQQQLLLDEQDAYIQSRADTMASIESTIVELGSIFQQLAHMVKEQEEMVQRIDANVEDTSLNVEAAHSEILRYFQSVTSNRWLMIKVFAVLIVFFIIFVVFVA